jgi:hypothetical protein
MPLVFRHVGLDFGQFPHLMPQRLGIDARQFPAAATTFGRFQRMHFVAFIDGKQRPFVLCMPRLTAPFALRFRLLRRRLGVWMLRAGRQRGVLRRFVEPRFQFFKLCQQRADYRLRLRRLTSYQFFRDFQRHALNVAEIRFCCQISFAKISFQGVNGYAAR